MVIQCLKARTRFFVLILLMFCLAVVFSNILSFNMVQICIDDKESVTNFSRTMTSENTLILSKSQQMWSQAVVAMGAIMAHFILIQFVVRAGTRTAFTTAGMLSGASVLLMVEALRTSFGFLLVLRIVQGIMFAANYIVIGSFISKWSYYKQQGLFVSVLAASSQLSPTLTNAVSGLLCSTLGWRSIFYFHGTLTEIIFALFLICYRNRPAKHPFVGTAEATKIQINKASVSIKTTPYGRILRTPAVWAVWIAAVGNFFPAAVLYLFSVNYFHSVLGLQVEAMGFIGALPTLLQFLLKIIAGVVSDRIKFLSDVAKVRIFNSIAFFGSSLIAATLSFATMAQPANVFFCEVLLALMIGILGISTGGFFKAASLISGSFAPFVTGSISTIFSLCLLIAPFLKTFLGADDTPTQWAIMLLICAAITAVTNLFFIFFINATPAKWTKTEMSINSTEKPISVVLKSENQSAESQQYRF